MSFTPSCGLRRLLTLAAVLAFAAACSTIETRHRDWSSYDGPGARAFAEPEPPAIDLIRDPIEPFNRHVAAFNDVLMDWVVTPLSVVWRAITPETARERLGLAADNLAFPKRAVNSLVQGKWREAGSESMRFVINTTVGLLGLFDPATTWKWRRSDEDTGQTLADAGWDDPAFLMLPVAGPSTTRDATGLGPDMLLDLINYIGGPASTFLRFNQLSLVERTYRRVTSTAPDAYELSRLVWSVIRNSETTDYQAPRATDGAANQTLKAVFLSPEDGDFDILAGERDVLIPATGRRLPYNCWLSEGARPLAVCVPGLGSHRSSNHALALAETVCNEGWHAVTVSSAFHPEFMKSAATSGTPGYAPRDAADLHHALDAIVRDVRSHCEVTDVVLVGLSMGAYQALQIAASEQARPDLVRFDLYVSVDAPISTRHAMVTLDTFYRAPLAWSAEDREERMLAALRKASHLGQGAVDPDLDLEFAESEARFLIGLSFRLTLADIIYASQRRNDLGVLLTELDDDDRGPAYREIREYSYIEYAFAFLLPWLQTEQPGATEADLFATSDLRTFTAELRANDRIFMVTHDNDPLLRDGDPDWIASIVPPERLRQSPEGGHLGAGADPELRRRSIQQIMAVLEALR